MIAEDQGYIFEVGFNIGILASFEKLKLGQRWVNFYSSDLQKLKFPLILQQLITRNQALNTLDRNLIDQWSQLVLLRGFLAGFNFFAEYFNSTEWKAQNTEVLYYQCCFINDNSINTCVRQEEEHISLIVEQFCQAVKTVDMGKILNYRHRYTKKGEFLKADSLIFLRHKQEYRVIVVDTSIFSLKSDKDVTNLELVEVIKNQLLKEINYLRSKSSFAKLRIDTGKNNNLDFSFSEGLKYHFTAFKYEDKESCKLIQAASYGYSFWKFLQETEIITPNDQITVSAVGNSERSLSTMTVSKDNFSLLETCYEIYQHDSSEKEINTARQQLLNLIKRQAYKSFNQGKQFVEQLFNIQPENITTITHRETIEDFFNTVETIPKEIAASCDLNCELNLRDAHAQLVNRALLDESPYLFLTGNPGIGKTTAIASFLKAHIEEGFLFFYVSPRKQVNIDILDKFKTEESLCDNRLFYLNTNAYLIANNSSNHTVEYMNNVEKNSFTLGDVNFVKLEEQEKFTGKKKSNFQRRGEDLLQPKNSSSKGVIASLAQGINQLIINNKSNQIIATACIQALKKTRVGDTLQHFETIFQSAYNSRTQEVVTSKMQAISKKIKHLFIMIDEITGDSSGVEFLEQIRIIFKKYNLLENHYGFNIKIIIADASIVNQDVINQHLGDTSPEGDKIFFRKTESQGLPLSWERFEFKGKDAIAINANSYPAKSLGITYKVVIKSAKFNEEERLKENPLIKLIQQEIIKDIGEIEKFSSGQILVYIQNKERLNQLIEIIKKQKEKFNLYEDYLEIHANITEYERRAIDSYKNRVKIIFMTSSGSRGLSFPLVKHILVDIPKFQIETNLMEMIQVIYRGRGDIDQDQQSKELIFYLAENAIYYDDKAQDLQLSLQECLLSILNLILLLKAAIMTRIKGSGVIGSGNYLIIPIGGKAITTVSNNFSWRMSNLLRELKQECRAKPWDILLKNMQLTFENLLDTAEFKLSKSKDNQAIISYLNLQKQLYDNFLKIINEGFDGLLKLNHLESAYLCGSLIIVPAMDSTMRENYVIKLEKIVKLEPQIRHNLKLIYDNRDKYHDNLRQAVEQAIDLIENLQNQSRSQNIEEQSKTEDLYYGFTLYTLLNNQVIKDYLAKEVEKDSRKFREILELYVRSLYSVGHVLPIGDRYEEFPFIIFNSYILKQMREKMFTDRYLLNSQEFNIVNLILSK